MKAQNVPADKVQSQTNPLLDSALAAAARGWPVFPLHDVASGRCSCGGQKNCRPGKHPRIRAWQHKATTDPEQIRRWWTTWPNANVALATGPESGIVALDVDGPTGARTLQALILKHGVFPPTLTNRTGRGGLHYVYRYPADRDVPNSEGTVGPGLDVRGRGGYILWPPSRTDHGFYSRQTDKAASDPAPWPDWLHALTLPRAPEPTSAAPIPPARPTSAPHVNGQAGGRPGPEQRAVEYLARCAAALSGQNGHKQTFRVARAVVYGFDVGPDVGFRLLWERWNPLCVPPWTDKELRHKCADADAKPFNKPRGYLLNESRPRAGAGTGKIGQIRPYIAPASENGAADGACDGAETGPAGSDGGAPDDRPTIPAPPPVPIAEPIDHVLDGLKSKTNGQARPRQGGAKEREPGQAGRGPADPPGPPRGGGGGGGGEPPDGPQLRALASVKERKPEWLWPGRIQRGAINFLEGSKCQGKTTIAAAVAASMTGGPLLPGQAKRADGDVLFLTVESCLESAIKPRMRVAGADPKRVHYLEQPGKPGRPYALSLPADLTLLERFIRREGIRLVVLDPWTSFTAPGFNLKDERDARFLLEQLGGVLAETGAAALLIRHLRKYSSGPALDQGLGSAGVAATARAVNCAYTDPDRKGGHVLAVVAANEAKPAPSLTYDLVPEAGAVRVRWTGETGLDADQLADGRSDATERDRLGRATRFLRSELSNGRQKTTILQERAQQAAVAWRTVERAKVELGVEAEANWEVDRIVWYWKLPPGVSKE